MESYVFINKRVMYPPYRSKREVKLVTDTKPGVKGVFLKIIEKHPPLHPHGGKRELFN